MVWAEYLLDEKTIWHELGVETPPPTAAPEPEADPFHREICLVRPFWMEVKEMEDKISACKDKGISRELVEEMSIPLWGAPGLESMQESFDTIKEVTLSL